MQILRQALGARSGGQWSLPAWALWIAVAAAAGCGGGATTGDATTLPSDGSGGDSLGDAGNGSGGQDATNADGSGDATKDVVAPLKPPAGGYAAIFLDVGQGDATVLIASTGEVALIDGGVSKTLLAKRLARLGLTRVDTIVATHADADHITGLPEALADYEVSRILWNGVSKGTQIFDAFLAAAKAETGAEIVIARRGDVFQLGNLQLEVLHPGPGADTSDDHNNESVVLQTGCAGGWLLMPGDSEHTAEDEMIAAGVLSDVDVLHAAHHGSSTGSGAAFLAKVQPEIAVISAGVENAYDHPDKEVVDRFEAAGMQIWRTDVGWDDDSVWMHADCKGGLVFGRVGD